MNEELKNNENTELDNNNRLVYNKNPRKFFNATADTGDFAHLIEETVWGEIQKKE